jgi:acyl carrier protein
MSKTREVLKEVARTRLEVELTDDVIESGKKFADIGVDSLEAIELIVELEEALDIELDDRRLDDVECIKDLAEYLAEFD